MNVGRQYMGFDNDKECVRAASEQIALSLFDLEKI